MGETLTLRSDRGVVEDGGVADRLVLAFECARPLAAPAWFDLTGVDELEIGRGAERRATLTGGRLRLDVADTAMSASHARLVRDGDDFVLEDLGSKNGTLANGQRIKRLAIHERDLLEAGETFFLLRRTVPPPARLDERPAFRTLCQPLARDLRTLERIAPSAVPILLEGETGTGKEVLARALHLESRRPGAFVAVNCGALPANLIESELFGARRGAFSGAVVDREGLVQAAHRGTLFLDEIAELPVTAQATLLRVLQTGEVRPLGDTAAVQLDLRVIAATHEDLAQRVERGGFRRDLYARLKGYRFRLPPLRERRDDLGLLVAAILGDAAPGLRLGRSAARALFCYDWPLNIRELEHALRAASAVGGADLELAHLPAELGAPAAPAAAKLTDDRARFMDLVRSHKGNVSALARALGTSRSHVRRLALRHGVDLAGERDM